MTNKVSIFRAEHFNAAHRLVNLEWDDAKNEEVFGKCAWPNFHGHNYEMVVKVSGEPDVKTGFVMDLKLLGEIITKEIVEKFDHKNLNIDLVEFKNLNPTAENIVVVIYNLLRPHIDVKNDLQVRLYETPRNFVEYPAD